MIKFDILNRMQRLGIRVIVMGVRRGGQEGAVAPWKINVPPIMRGIYNCKPGMGFKQTSKTLNTLDPT